MSAPGQRFQRMLDGATVAVFMALLLTPLAAMVLGTGTQGAAGGSEKRTLAAAPSRPRTWSEALRWPDAADAFLRDGFGFRQTLIRWHSRLLYSVFRTSSSPKVVIGRDGWLYYTGGADDGLPIDDYRGSKPIPAAQLEWLRWMIQDQYEWLHERGIRYLFVMVPSKEQIHPEHLPPAITRVGPRTAREQLLDHLAGRGLPVLDLAPALREAGRRAPVFLKTDTHWNTYGCLVAARAILDALGLPSEGDDAFTVDPVRMKGGDLALLMNLSDYLSEIDAARSPHSPPRARWRGVGTGDMAEIVGGVDDPALLRAVVYRDSFTDGLVPHLTERFREIRYIWGRYGAKMVRVPDFKPDIVIQIMGDRVFRENVQYSPEIQEERLRRRIDAGSELIWRREAWTADLPPPRDARNHLPVIQVDLTARRRTALELTWGKGGEGGCTVQPGRGRALLPVLDPDATPPFRLHVKGRADDVVIHSIELREISR
jgi:alginate O-acetyltransferase complex protein AlgJ